MTELLITSKIPGKLIYWDVPSGSLIQTTDEGETGANYVGQKFTAKDKKILRFMFYYDPSYTVPSNIEIQLWDGDLSEKLETLYDGPSGGNGWQTYEIAGMNTELTIGSTYAMVVYGKGDCVYGRRSNSSVMEGELVTSSDGSSWSEYPNYDLVFKLYFGDRVITVEDLGYSEAYLLRIQYLEDNTWIVMDDEINFRGDAGEEDDLPSQILIPFKKFEWKGGHAKMFGVGIP